MSEAMLYPLLFHPIFQERIWGGRALERLYGKKLPPGTKIGESWEISDRPEACSVIANGSFAGKTIEWLMREHQNALLGNAKPLGGRFPLLIKILDAEEKLSLQVHPPAEKASELGGEPKTEMWYIAEAQPGAELYVGLKRGISRQEFETRIHAGTVADCFHRVPVRNGDVMFLPSGRVHAIGAGLVIFEIQQNSDTTYRVFDWNRVDSQGKPRQLHVRESLECIDFQDFEPEAIRASTRNQLLVNDLLFQVEAVSLAAGEERKVPLPACGIVAVIDGTVRIPDRLHPVELRAGEFCLLPSELECAAIRAPDAARVLLATPGG